MLVEVAVAAAVRGTFTYRVPSRLAGEVSLGSRVAVPFGKSPRATGYVVGLPTVPPKGIELRDVAGVLDEFPPSPRRCSGSSAGRRSTTWRLPGSSCGPPCRRA